MKEKMIISKVARDMFLEQLKWSLWFIGIVVLLHVVFFILSSQFDFKINNLFTFSYMAAPIYMLIIGIIAGTSFLPFFVKHGVTRKDYFWGSSVAALILSFSLAIIFSALSGLERGIFTAFNLILTYKLPGLETWSYGIIPDLFIYMLNIFTYYLLGWLVYVAFYRFKWIIGFAFCVLAFIFTSLHGFIWNKATIAQDNVTIYLFGFKMPNELANIPLSASILGTIALLVILLCLIRLLTKRIPIKL